MRNMSKRSFADRQNAKCDATRFRCNVMLFVRGASELNAIEGVVVKKWWGVYRDRSTRRVASTNSLARFSRLGSFYSSQSFNRQTIHYHRKQHKISRPR